MTFNFAITLHLNCDLICAGSKKAAKEQGLARLESKDCVMREDVVNFRFNV
ncbi:MAG: hypothetical protein ACR2N3_04165 [Pyrinomonadaceae bacterium]